MEETLRSPLAESVSKITDRSQVKPQPTEVATEEELGHWERCLGLYVTPDEVCRLLVTVRALQRDLTEVRAKLVVAREILKGVE